MLNFLLMQNIEIKNRIKGKNKIEPGKKPEL
jgi:hypothetical protein